MALKDKIEALANAIRRKSGVTGPLGWDGMKEAVESITVGSGGDGLDTSSTNPATAEDIAKGKEAFVNGSKVTGNVTTCESNLVFDVSRITSYYNNLNNQMQMELTVDIKNNYLFRKDSKLHADIACTEFGDAEESDVVDGKKFTSKDGVMKTGKHVCSGGGGGISLPSGVTAITAGEFTPDADITAQYTITHNLNTTPSVFILEPCGTFKVSDNKGYILQCVINTKTHTASSTVKGMSVVTVVDVNNGTVTHVGINNPTCTDTTIDLPTYTARKLKAGTTYKWVAIAMEGIN